MRRIGVYSVTSVFLMAVLVSCGPKVPLYRVWRPWTRTLGSNSQISPDARLKIEVSGETKPLLGSESNLREHIAEMLHDLLGRRGFQFVDNDWDFKVIFRYQTEEKSSLDFRTTHYSDNLRGAIIGSQISAKNFGYLGALIARSVAMSIETSSEGTMMAAKQTTVFRHTISIEIQDLADSQLWASESLWDTSTPDLLEELYPAMQLLLCEMPKDVEVNPVVQEVKEDRIDDYYRERCEGRWFSCPALPYRIAFGNYESAKEKEEKQGVGAAFGFEYYRKRHTRSFTKAQVTKLSDGRVMEAIRDLIQTAERVLPYGKSAKGGPTDINKWRQVQLAGRYVLTPAHDTVDVLVDLSGDVEGYYVERFRIPTPNELNDFEARYANWVEELKSYYDFYKD